MLTLTLQIMYLEEDLDKGGDSVLCTRVDEHAGDWPAESYLGLMHIAKRCVEVKMANRPEIAEVSTHPFSTCCPGENTVGNTRSA